MDKCVDWWACPCDRWLLSNCLPGVKALPPPLSIVTSSFGCLYREAGLQSLITECMEYNLSMGLACP
ncbi:hypothetical protein AAFF_G00161430 [Aldrovandia affinis]|uniref:Uncharacterized protein n=1 Tax=Aldrovandia affinis TaxID=143900 RepID=A0AAD7W7D2_9TELE|nr:hypothetical protein AAFF_G00161430 [Aldrovandia affinis]